ncbi:MAG: nucleoside-diphosphate kinase [Nanoarchaeota archaeon]
MKKPVIERSLILIKPDGVMKGLVGDIVKRFEQMRLNLVAMKMILADDRLADQHYLFTESWANALGEKTREAYQKKGIELKESNFELAQRVKKWNMSFLREGPVVAFVVEGPHAVELGRKLVGNTEPRQALPGTIRGDFSFDSYALSDAQQRPVRNIIHASGTVVEAEREIGLWFSADEIYKYRGLADHSII